MQRNAKQAELFEEPRPRAELVSRSWGFSRIVLTNCYVQCHKCGEFVPVELRRMGNGEVRNQPRCRPCRTDAYRK